MNKPEIRQRPDNKQLCHSQNGLHWLLEYAPPSAFDYKHAFQSGFRLVHMLLRSILHTFVRLDLDWPETQPREVVG